MTALRPVMPAVEPLTRQQPASPGDREPWTGQGIPARRTRRGCRASPTRTVWMSRNVGGCGVGLIARTCAKQSGCIRCARGYALTSAGRPSRCCRRGDSSCSPRSAMAMRPSRRLPTRDRTACSSTSTYPDRTGSPSQGR
jgi:hypothetical protein